MLDAALKNKMRTYNLVEDEITSEIFGWLRFLDTPSVYSFFKALVGKAYWNNPNFHFVHNTPRNDLQHEVCFWDRLENGKEPDIIIKFYDVITRGLLTQFMIEIKWDSPHRSNQLSDQWDSVSMAQQTIHLYLVKLANYDIQKLAECSHPVAYLSWNIFSAVASELSGGSPLFKEWANAITKFLHDQGEYVFLGFEQIPMPLLSPLAWRPIWHAFLGFSQFNSALHPHVNWKPRFDPN